VADPLTVPRTLQQKVIAARGPLHREENRPWADFYVCPYRCHSSAMR